MSEQLRVMRLPEELCAAAEARFGVSCTGIEELLGTVLRELLSDECMKKDEAEQKLIEERLRELGYL
ncbi:MAG TPA: hypothetical protein VFA89_24450 [Terriglobales bacterium]|nr:hypothetical protein [Terriglobales bacterium]